MTEEQKQMAVRLVLFRNKGFHGWDDPEWPMRITPSGKVWYRFTRQAGKTFEWGRRGTREYHDEVTDPELIRLLNMAAFPEIVE